MKCKAVHDPILLKDIGFSCVLEMNCSLQTVLKNPFQLHILLKGKHEYN